MRGSWLFFLVSIEKVSFGFHMGLIAFSMGCITLSTFPGVSETHDNDYDYDSAEPFFYFFAQIGMAIRIRPNSGHCERVFNGMEGHKHWLGENVICLYSFFICIHRILIPCHHGVLIWVWMGNSLICDE